MIYKVELSVEVPDDMSQTEIENRLHSITLMNVSIINVCRVGRSYPIPSMNGYTSSAWIYSDQSNTIRLGVNETTR